MRRLQKPIVQKLERALDELARFGPRHPPLHMRQVERNPDGRYRFLNVDEKYRIVAVLEGDAILLEKVGNHDETLAWGEKASLREYQERLEVADLRLGRPKAEMPASKEPVLFTAQLSVPQIFERTEDLSDLMTGDLFGSLEGYRDGLIEDWMVFLSPLQRRAVSRAVNGPARVTGGPGTGKTVVGLHRAVEFARRAAGPRRVLVTSFVNNVPEVLAGLFERLALAELHDRVDFRTIHSVAGQALARSGRRVNVDDAAARSRFERCYDADHGRRDALLRAGFTRPYLWDEVSRVIEGREVNSLELYLTLARHGRRQRMNEAERRLTWDIYLEYREACTRLDPPIVSWGRHLAEARAALAAAPTAPRYDAVIVDEAQDITEVGIRLLGDLLEGGAAGQLLLIGDNAQRIYPGGFRLADLGIEVRGRSFALSLCYRSTDEIMRAAAALGKFVSTEDFGDDALRDSNWTPARYGQKPTLREFRSVADERAWVLDTLRGSQDLADATGLLVPTNNLKDYWKRELSTAGIAVCDLQNYAGRPTPGVKVGTYNRAKGLEFKRVLLPNLNDFGIRPDPNRLDELIVRGSQLFVAMTRARDVLELSYSGQPSMFVDAVLEHVEVS